AVPEAMVAAQLTARAEDLPPAALKTGMLAEAGIVRLVAKAIRENGWQPLVLDPVMVSTSGHRLLSTEAEDVMRDIPTMERAGETLLRFGAAAALVKGGHLPDDGGALTDVLVTPEGIRHFTHERLDTTSTHGTGCTLSAAVTAGLALGRPLETAVVDALDFVHRAMASAPGLGGGRGPLDHTVTAPPPPPR